MSATSPQSKQNDFKVADLSLAEWGRKEIAIAEGEIVCVIGPNGAGKTTLMKTIAGLLRPRSGAILFEGWARSAKQAQAMAARGGIEFAPCHHHSAVGPMAGIISPSMPVWIVKNAAHGNSAYSNLNEGLGKVLRFGANSPEVIARLAWMQKTLAPTLRAGLERLAHDHAPGLAREADKLCPRP